MSGDDTEQDGGPAFPVSLPGMGDNGASGMTLRDWFAGQALAGDLVAAGGGVPDRLPSADYGELMARRAYFFADAMLAARAAAGGQR